MKEAMGDFVPFSFPILITGFAMSDSATDPVNPELVFHTWTHYFSVLSTQIFSRCLLLLMSIWICLNLSSLGVDVLPATRMRVLRYTPHLQLLITASSNAPARVSDGYSSDWLPDASGRLGLTLRLLVQHQHSGGCWGHLEKWSTLCFSPSLPHSPSIISSPGFPCPLCSVPFFPPLPTLHLSLLQINEPINKSWDLKYGKKTTIYQEEKEKRNKGLMK